jgi:4-hydroxy-2-oxoheptanedioate aldolase
MDIPKNHLKAALKRGEPQTGLWMSLATPYCAEICAGAGFDFIVIDAEHGPNDVRTVLATLQAVSAYPVQTVVRPKIGDVSLIKQVLDVGAQTLVIPLVETAEQAQTLVKAMRYPPEGIRGCAPAVARAARWGRVSDYLHQADEEMCLIVQIETKKGLDNLESIAAVHGVDGLFIGPADLSASLGYRGQPNDPEVQAVMDRAIARIKKTGKAAGILWTEDNGIRRYLNSGVTFMAVGVDVAILAGGTQELAKRFKS